MIFISVQFISVCVVCLMVGELLMKHLIFHCVSVARTSTLWWTLLLPWRKKEPVYFALISPEMGKLLVLKEPLDKEGAFSLTVVNVVSVAYCDWCEQYHLLIQVQFFLVIGATIQFVFNLWLLFLPYHSLIVFTATT